MEPKRRRRRVRAPEAAPPGAEPTEVGPVAANSPVHDEPWTGGPANDGEAPLSERGLRGLVGGGSSQVSPTVALRARDAARPRPVDLERAAAELTIIRRNWSPRD